MPHGIHDAPLWVLTCTVIHAVSKGLRTTTAHACVISCVAQLNTRISAGLLGLGQRLCIDIVRLLT